MKQAVVLIHGIGEQKPMDTLRSFVGAVLGPGEDGRAAYYSKPDPMSELMELRRLQAVGRQTTHFFEYYWAYNVEGTKIGDVFRWLVGLILRRGRNVPGSTKALWRLSRALVVAVVISSLIGVPGQVRSWFEAQAVLSAIWIAGVGLVLILQLVVVSYLGDAARYLSPRPANIRLRHAIRSEGVKLLRALHDEYDRIIVVGHSLGSVIGYDLITHLWQEFNDKYPGLARPDVQEKVRECLVRGVHVQPIVRNELSAAGEALKPGAPGAAGDFQKVQLEAWREQHLLGNRWRISDFVTLGSPLTHGMLLLARSRDDFESRKRQRELPTCPPQRDEKGYAYSPPTPVDIGDGRKFTPLTLHHAAPFAVTSWTNLYFPARLGLFGDVVGGPLQPTFGPGVRDIAVRTTAFSGWANYTLAAHNSYWHAGDEAAKGPEPRAGLPLSLPQLEDVLALSFLRRYTPREWVQLHTNG
jgi:hypothetical protein